MSSDLSMKDRTRMARTLRRRPENEAELVAGVGGSLLFVLCFWTAPYSAITTGQSASLSLVGVAFVLFFGMKCLAAIAHRGRLGPKIMEAQKLEADMQYVQQDKQTEFRPERVAAKVEGS